MLKMKKKNCLIKLKKKKLLNIFDATFSDPEMEVCYKGNREPSRTSCCSRKMERRYHQAAENDFYEVIRSTSSYLKNLLSLNAAQYKGKNGF